MYYMMSTVNDDATLDGARNFNAVAGMEQRGTVDALS